MTHSLGYRGAQPPYNRPSVSLRKPGQGTVQPTAQSVRFSGGAVQNTLTNGWQGFVNLNLPAFEKITEVFIWGFLAQDVIAMWLPRIYALLTEGRKAYDPKDDPQAKNKPFGTQVKKWVAGNLKGLNWDNFNEGTKREFATGPGLLMVPAGLFLAANRFTNKAIKMPFPALKGMGKGLADHLDDATQANYQEKVQDYVENIFQDPKLMANKGAHSQKAVIKQWSKEWVDNLFLEKDPKNPKVKADNIKTLSEKLQSTIRTFNRDHRMLAYSKAESGNDVSRIIEDANPLYRSDSTWVSYKPKRLSEYLDPKEQNLDKAANCLRQKPVTEVLQDLENMEHLVKAIGKKATGSTTLADAAKQTMETMVKRKLYIAIGATTITAAYLTKLAFWAQSHNTYQATRFLHEKTAQNKTSNHSSRHNMGANAATQCMTPSPAISTTAGSTYGLQPAFSNLPQAQQVPFCPPGQPLMGGSLMQQSDPIAARNAFKFGVTERGNA